MNMSILYAILICVGACVGIALVWFLVELVITLKKTRNKVNEIHTQITPTLENIESITTKIQPAIDKVDPLIERITLTIDAANLELMRADQILENFNSISENALNATAAVENIASAPADLLSKAGHKISGIFTGGAKSVTGLLNDPKEKGGNVNKIVKQSKKQGRRVAKKAKKIAAPVNEPAVEAVPAINQKQKSVTYPDTTNSNPYVTFRK